MKDDNQVGIELIGKAVNYLASDRIKEARFYGRKMTYDNARAEVTEELARTLAGLVKASRSHDELKYALRFNPDDSWESEDEQ